MRHSWGNDIETQSGQGICEFVDTGQFEAVGDETLKQLTGIELMYDEMLGDAIVCHKSVAAFHGRASGMAIR
jgi:hypothetical protein